MHLILLVAACTPSDDGGRRPSDDTPTGDTASTGSLPPPDTGSTADTAPTALPTGDTGTAPYDCSVLPPIPTGFTQMPEFETNEDFDLDGDGFLCTNRDQNLGCKDQAGNTKIAAPNIGLTSGVRILADGDWVINNQLTGTVVRVDITTGGTAPLLGGMNYPNGLEVGRDGFVFVAEHGAGAVRQIELATGAWNLVATGLTDPNGVILSPDEQTLYVNSFGGGVVYAVDRLGPTDWDTPRLLNVPPTVTGEFDGLNVDICGNVYITEYTVGKVYRVTDDGGLGNALIADLPESWIPNLRWGHDLGGWSSSTLYVAAWDSGVYALDMGIPGKKHVLMP